jgi:hypothetical protein
MRFLRDVIYYVWIIKCWFNHKRLHKVISWGFRKFQPIPKE